jgi:hypothetical protein
VNLLGREPRDAELLQRIVVTSNDARRRVDDGPVEIDEDGVEQRGAPLVWLPALRDGRGRVKLP